LISSSDTSKSLAMKKLLLGFLIIQSFSSKVAAQQNWFLPGATLTDGINWFAHYGYVDYVVVGDTVYDGVNCKHLLKTQVQATQQSSIIDTSYDQAFAYELGGYVFGSYNGFSNNAFDTIYNFNAVPGDTWGLYYNCCGSDTAYVEVIDTSHIVLNGYTLKTQLIAYHGTLIDGAIDTFIERMGSTKLGFYLSSPCVTDNKYGFCSYEDSEVGYYGWFDCDSIEVGIEESQLNETTIHLFPNPATHYTDITFSQPLRNGIIVLTDLSGKEILTTPVEGSFMRIHIADISAGMYLLNIYEHGNRIISKSLAVQK